MRACIGIQWGSDEQPAGIVLPHGLSLVETPEAHHFLHIVVNADIATFTIFRVRRDGHRTDVYRTVQPADQIGGYVRLCFIDL